MDSTLRNAAFSGDLGRLGQEHIRACLTLTTLWDLKLERKRPSTRTSLLDFKVQWVNAKSANRWKAEMMTVMEKITDSYRTGLQMWETIERMSAESDILNS
jgi:hypothetical protein